MTEGTGYVIELGGEAAGLVVKEGNRFRFYASAKSYAPLERTLYRTPGEDEDACRRVAFPGRAPRPQPTARSVSERYIPAGLLAYGRRPATT